MSNLIQFIPDLKKSIINVVSTLNVEQNWGLAYVDVQDAWKHTKGEGVHVAIIDTGWYAHKDLIVNFVEGFDATGNDDYLDHGNFHSVHVAGIIAANSGDENIGVTGIAPESKLHIIKALDDSGAGSFDYILKALQIAKDLNVDIINMSLGTPVKPDNEDIHKAIQDIVVQGKIIICAAGNDGGDVNYPAKYDEAIAVAAVDSNGALTKFSSRGPELDTAAPGVHIYSTWGNNQYVNLDGTSMACPAITGIVALIISWMKKEGRQSEISYKTILKTLYELGEKNIINMGTYSFGVPKFCNYNWNK